MGSNHPITIMVIDKRLLRIVQVSKHMWQLENSKGTVLTSDLTLESTYRAEEWIKNYISSFHCYNYEVIPLKKEKKDE